MRFIDRFTRDDVQRQVWWPFTMVLLVLFVLTFPPSTARSTRGIAETAAVDAALSQRVIQPNVAVGSRIVVDRGTAWRRPHRKVHDEILVNDARIRAVRIWSPSMSCCGRRVLDDAARFRSAR